MPKTKATNRVVAAIPESAVTTPVTAARSAALEAQVGDELEQRRKGAASAVVPKTMTLTRSTVDVLDEMVFELKKIGVRSSASALVEAAVLDLYVAASSSVPNSDARVIDKPDVMRKVVRRHVGEHTARRRSP